MRNWSACVVGGGVVGLTTALLAQEKGAKVTLVADKFDKETTSDGAAGIFEPANFFHIVSPEITKELIDYSYKYYEKLLGDKDAGVSVLSGYHLSNEFENTRNHLLEGVVPEYRSATSQELRQFPGGWKFGAYYTTLLIECRFYLPWAAKKFISQGGKIVKASLNSLSDVKSYGDFDIVFNCSGYGAKKLCGDNKMVAVSGQIYSLKGRADLFKVPLMACFQLEAPWCDKFLIGDEDTYIIPGYLVTVGGSRHFESYRTVPCPHDGAAIWSRAKALMPQLQTSQIRRQWVGVRPYRSGGVRVQAEVTSGLKVVHNYGHGGYGVTSAPGTAFHAVQLAEELLTSSKL